MEGYDIPIGADFSGVQRAFAKIGEAVNKAGKPSDAEAGGALARIALECYRAAPAMAREELARAGDIPSGLGFLDGIDDARFTDFLLELFEYQVTCQTIPHAMQAEYLAGVPLFRRILLNEARSIRSMPRTKTNGRKKKIRPRTGGRKRKAGGGKQPPSLVKVACMLKDLSEMAAGYKRWIDHEPSLEKDTNSRRAAEYFEAGKHRAKRWMEDGRNRAAPVDTDKEIRHLLERYSVAEAVSDKFGRDSHVSWGRGLECEESIFFTVLAEALGSKIYK